MYTYTHMRIKHIFIHSNKQIYKLYSIYIQNDIHKNTFFRKHNELYSYILLKLKPSQLSI